VILIDQTALLRKQLAQSKAKGRVAFVPTMGNLHEGHLALVREARALAETVVVSIFVNPLQFSAGEDLDNYPRTMANDQAALQAEGVDVLFVPAVMQMYPRPADQQTRVEVPGLSSLYCGATRPGHFAGVATVVCKLFNMVQPDVALFGKKDYQQLLVIRHMVEDLSMPIEIIGIDTVREVDGLAMSSRNQYLNDTERAVAPVLRQQLQQLAVKLGKGEKDISALRQLAVENLDAAGFETDYVEFVDAETLQEMNEDTQHIVVLAAAKLGAARLIDNIEVPLS